MNPDTKLTLEQIKAICVKHKIPYKHHTRVTTGFSHEVHRLNDDLIIKIFNNHDELDRRHFKTEAAVLASDLPIKKPRIIAKSDKDEDFDRSYIIMSFVPGISLGSNWHRANNTQREALIRSICQSLKVINRIKPVDLGLSVNETWKTSLKSRGENLVAKLKNKNIMDANEGEVVLRKLNENINAFTDDNVYPVYWDIHFDNFIVNEDFELQAIIDIENVELATLDYPLFVIQKQTDEPEKYLSVADEKYADKKDYTHLRDWYEKYYPEMFMFENLATRLATYQLLDVLHLLVDWSHVKSLKKKLEELVS